MSWSTASRVEIRSTRSSSGRAFPQWRAAFLRPLPALITTDRTPEVGRVDPRGDRALPNGAAAATAEDDRAAAGLVVEELRRLSATVVLSFFSDGLGQTRRREAELQAETRTLIVEGIVPGSSVRYTPQPDDTLLRRLDLDDDSGQLITMTLRRVLWHVGKALSRAG